MKAVSKPSPRTDWSLLAAAVGNVAQSRRFFPSVVTTISLLLFLPALVPGSLLAYRDSAHFYPPLYSLIRNEWLAGRVPLWNDMLNGGQPLAAMGTAGAFYPPQLLLTALLPDGLSLNLNMILHLAFAATGAYRLARQQSLSRAAATLAGISYAYGGGVLLQVYNPIFVVGSAWLVWAMLAGSWLLQGGGVRAFLLLAAALAMAVYGGDPQAAYHVGLVLAAWWWAFHRRLDGLILLAGAAALAGALAFVQVALTAEFLQGTSRAIDAAPYSIWQIPGFLMRGQTAHPASHWYDIIFGRAAATGSHYRSMYGFPFRPWQMAEFLWPGFAGPLDDRWPARLGLEDEHVWVNTPFAGMLPAISIVAACIPARRQTPTLRFWKWLFVAALTAACGSLGVVGVVRRAASLCSGQGLLLDYEIGDEVGGLYWIFAVFLPGYAGFRYPAKWLPVVVLAMTQVGGQMIGSLDTDWIRRRLTIVSGGLAALIGLATLSLIIIRMHAPLWVIAGGIHAIAMLIATAWALRSWSGWSPSGRSAVTGSLVLLSMIDLVMTLHPEIRVGSMASIVEASGYLEELKDRRRPEMAAASPRMRVSAFGGLFSTPRERRDVDRYTWSIGTALLGHIPWLHDVEKIGELGTAMPAATEMLTHCRKTPDGAIAAPRRAADLMGIEFFAIETDAESLERYTDFLRDWSADQRQGAFVHPRPQGGNLPTLELFTPDEGATSPLLYVVRNETAVPRVRIVRTFVRVPPVAADDWLELRRRIDLIAFPSQDVPDLTRTAIIDEAVATESSSSSVGDTPETDQCRIVVNESQQVVIEAQLREPGMVVLSDTFHPDWRLTVSTAGGPPRPTEILRVNQVHRGCMLPAGNHLLHYTYHSRIFRRAAWITLVAWLGAALTLFVAVRVERRARQAEQPGQ